MSVLPKAVQAQLDQAEALQAQLSAEAAPATGNPVEEAAEPQPSLQQEVTRPQETQVIEPSIPDETWEQRFRIMEGKFKAEVPRLHETNRQLTEQLERALAALEQKAKEPAPQPEPQAPRFGTDADVETFGADLVDMVRRATVASGEEWMRKAMAEIDRRLGEVTDKVTKTEERVVKSDVDKFWDVVRKDHADFDAVNSDPRWFEFLDQRIPGTRFTRRAVAEDAIRTLDASTLCEQVKAFKDAIGIKPVETASEKPAKSKPNLNSQVAPSSSKASVPTEPTGRVWSGAEYAAALDHRNLQRMSREEYEAQVAEAEQALAEGRVRF